MTVKELKEKLNELPENMEIYIPVNTVVNDYDKANTVYVEKITIDESEQYDDGVELIDVLIIDK
jgi:hypothetical protein